MKKAQSSGLNGSWRVWIAATVIVLFGMCGSTWAFDIPTGIPDIRLRWDNTLKYNLGVRVNPQEGAIINSLNYDDGDRNFKRGIVTNRLDIFSEIDAIYKRDYGVRASGTFYFDAAYYRGGFDHNSILTSNTIESGRQTLDLSKRTKRYFRGPYADLLDAYAFGKVDVGPVPVTIRLGRHTIYWGESFFTNQSISYSQAPIDAAKGTAVPGTGLKELFRPLAQVSVSAQLPNSLSISAHKYFQWEPYRMPEAGSYFGPFDMFLKGGDSLLLAPGAFIPSHPDIEPDGLKDWGIAARWSPAWFSGTFGLYYRNLSDMVPSQLYMVLGPTFVPETYFWAYGDKIKLVGASASMKVFYISVGAELSYRNNMPLANAAVVLLPGQPFPREGELFGARGKTMHGVLNFMGLINRTPIWDVANYIVEFGWDHLVSVDKGREYYMGRSSYKGIDKSDRDAVGINVSFTPKWYQVFPGIDLSAPLSVGCGLWNDSALPASWAQGAGSYNVGLQLDMYQKYLISLAWIDYFGEFKRDATGGVGVFRGINALQRDRGWLSLTFKMTI